MNSETGEPDWATIAEEHAFAVRQLIGQRTRLRSVLDIVVAMYNGNNAAAAQDGAPIDLASAIGALDLTKSQFLQDVYCLLLNNGKRNGFFVEFGACDGEFISNTWMLENHFGWKGIISEPARGWHEALKKNRSCVVETRCVWSTTGETLTFTELDNDQARDQSFVQVEGQPVVGEGYDVETISLVDMLRENNAPAVIDFMSIDVEGNELEILKDFPFDTYRFDFLCVEHPIEENEIALKKVLHAAGYRQILTEASGYDGFYIPRERHDALGFLLKD